jgi:hypothetical protein
METPFRGSAPLTAEIWLSQSLVSWNDRLYRAQIDTTTIRFGSTTRAFGANLQMEINRVTGRWSENLLAERPPVLGDFTTGHCE